MKILLAEDTKDMNRVLTVALEHEGHSVDSAFDGEQALNFIETNGYDALILDIMMPKIDGIQALKTIRAENITTPVLMLTAKAEIDDRVEGLDAGADDYLTKPFAMKELLARVRAMARRKNEYDSDIRTYEDLILNPENGELKCENSVRLSIKEFELLQELIKCGNQYVQTQFLLNKVWNSEINEVSTDTVALYIRYLKSKLKAISSKVVIEGNLEVGFQLVVSE